MCASTRAWYASLRLVRKFQPLELRSAACFAGLGSVAPGLLMFGEVHAMHTTGTSSACAGSPS